MLAQVTLEGSKVQEPNSPETIKALCCKRCYNAKRDRCHCKCKKLFHGLGRKICLAKQEKEKELNEIDLRKY